MKIKKNFSPQIGENGKYGYVRGNGSWAIEPQFDSARDFSDGLAAVRIGDKCGYVGYDGSWAIEPQFDSFNSFSGGLAKVEVKGKYGYIRSDGSWAFEPQFDSAIGFSGGFARVRVGDKEGYVRADGSWVFEPQFDNAWYFSEGIAKVEVDGKYGYVRSDGSWAFEPKFEDASAFSEGILMLKADGKYGLFHKNGNCIADIIYDTIKSPKEGYIRVSRNNKWGYMRPDGSFLVVPKFDYAWDFSGGKARVNQGLEIGYIDESLSFTPITAENDPELKKLEEMLKDMHNRKVTYQAVRDCVVSPINFLRSQLKSTIPYGIVIYSIDPSTTNIEPKTAVPIWFTWEEEKSFTRYKIGGTKFIFGDYRFYAFQLVDSYNWYNDTIKLATIKHPFTSKHKYCVIEDLGENLNAISKLIECYKKGWIGRLEDIEDGNSDGIELQLAPDLDYSELANN